jgi:hypothetical protein
MNDQQDPETPPTTVQSEAKETNRYAQLPKRYWKITRFNPKWQEGDPREHQVEEIMIAGHMMIQMDGGVIGISEVISYPDGSLAPTVRRLFNHWIDIEEVAVGNAFTNGRLH